MRKVGFTTVEILVALGLLSLCLYSVLSLIPTADRSLRRAEDLQAATAYGQEVVQALRARFPAQDVSQTFPVTLNNTQFNVTRTTVTLETAAAPSPYSLHGIEVKVVRADRQGEPVVLRTRLAVRNP